MKKKKENKARRENYMDLFNYGIISDEALNELLDFEELYINTKRKYEIEKPIESIEELLSLEQVYMWGEVRDKKFISSQPFQRILDYLKKGYIKKIRERTEEDGLPF